MVPVPPVGGGAEVGRESSYLLVFLALMVSVTAMGLAVSGAVIGVRALRRRCDVRLWAPVLAIAALSLAPFAPLVAMVIADPAFTH